MIKIGFKRSEADYSLYILITDEGIIYFVLYVDDILMIGSNVQKMREVKQLLSETFKIKDLGDVKQFMGLSIVYDKQQFVNIS